MYMFDYVILMTCFFCTNAILIWLYIRLDVVSVHAWLPLQIDETYHDGKLGIESFGQFIALIFYTHYAERKVWVYSAPIGA